MSLPQSQRDPEPIAQQNETPAKLQDLPEDDLQHGRQHYAARRFAEAARYLQIYCAAHPDDAGASCDPCLRLDRTGPGRRSAAHRCTGRSGRTRISSPAHINLGVALLKLNRPHEAIGSLKAALGLAPDDPIACFNYGVALGASGHHEDAVAWLQKAKALRPGHAETLLELGHAHRAAGHPDDAVGAYRRACQARPGFLAAAQNLAKLLHAERRYNEAADAFQAALAIDPAQAGLWNDLGTAHQGAGRYVEAVDSYRRAIVEQPGLAAAYCNMALSLAALNRFEEGITACRQAAALEAGGAAPNMNLGFLLLTLGRYAEGWACYEYRFAIGHKAWFRPEAQAQPWLGEDLNGKSILVVGEQGNGDHIQFARYLPLLADLGATVTFLATARLHGLLGTLRGPITLAGTLPPQSRFDYQWPLMSLPLRFQQRGTGIPAETPYLAAEPGRAGRWRERIGTHGLRIGIAWQGNKEGAVDAGRSFALERMRPLARLPGVRLISLQLGEAAQQIADLLPGMIVETLGEDFDAGGDAFLDTAAVMQAVDMVVTSDTAIAHLAGALGCRLWVALNSAPEWRWLRGRDDSPWYPTARLFRQPVAGDWDSVFEAMAAALATIPDPARVTSPVPRVPLSYGDLFDKACILEIKSERFSGAALTNVSRELDSLRSTVAMLGALPPGLSELRRSLKAANERLWQLEDEIRAFEADGLFEHAFVEVARMIYRVNDERGRIKRQINEVSGSALIEEKKYQVY